MISQLPPPPPTIGAIPHYLVALSRALSEMFNSVVSQNEPAERVILRSPNGTLYFIAVEDDGTLNVHPASDLPDNL